MSFGGKSFHEELSGMRPYELGDVNKLAGVGFFLSLIGAEVMGLLLYCGQKNSERTGSALESRQNRTDK